MIPIGRFKLRPRDVGDPEIIGTYRVLAWLGKGGFGDVYAARAEARYRGELVAVKRLRSEITDDSLDRGRFEREISSMERVSSGFVPHLVDSDSGANVPWLAAELIPGISLADVVDARGPLPEAAVWRLGAAMTEALAAIHAAGCVHRDLKPQNVLLEPEHPWVIDFGLAHVLELPRHPSSLRRMATPRYAAPEQLNRLGDAKSPADIFELGGTLLFAATGHAPHDTDSWSNSFTRQPTELPDLSGLPRGQLRSLIERCLRYVPEERPRLDELRTVFASRAGGHDVSSGFAAVLPHDVIDLLDDYEEELAKVLGGRGPARLGWHGPGTLPGRDDFAGGADAIYALHAPAELRPSSRSAPREANEDHSAGQLNKPTVRNRRHALRRAKDRYGDAVPEHATAGAGAADQDADAVARGGTAGYGSTFGQDIGDEGWPHQFDAWICGSVAIHDDLCLVTCSDGTIWRISAVDSTDRWRLFADLGGPVNGAAVIVPRRLGFDGAVFAAAHDGSVRAINLASGEGREVLPAGPPIEGSPVLVQDRDALRNFVYVVRTDGCLYGIDPASGEGSEAPIHHLGNGATGAMAAVPGVVAVADAKGMVEVLDTDSGRVIRRIHTQGQVFGAPVIANGHVYVASTDGQVRAARLGGNGAPDDGVRDLAGVGAPVHASPVYRGGRLYVGTSGGRVHAFDVRDVREVRYMVSDPLGGEIAGLAATAAGTLYAAAGYRMVAIDGATVQLRSVPLELNCLISGTPVIFSGYCYATGLGGLVERVVLH